MEFFQGLDLTLICNIELHPTVDTSVVVESMWSSNETYLKAGDDDRITITNTTNFSNSSNYQTTVRINPLDFDDSQSYNCTVFVVPENETFIVGTTTSTTRTIANISSVS